jgi:hypothetical protein
MDPILQWMLGIYATLSVAAVIGMAKFLYGIDQKMGKLDLKVQLFVQSAETRFESHEDAIAGLKEDVKRLDGKQVHK